MPSVKMIKGVKALKVSQTASKMNLSTCSFH